MLRLSALSRLLCACFILLALSVVAAAQRQSNGDNESTFGPVMRAYLGYLSNEQEVVDDRNSRREISAAYYHRNSNRIRALRQMAIKLVRDSGSDYVPELEAVALTSFVRCLRSRPIQQPFVRTRSWLTSSDFWAWHTLAMCFIFLRDSTLTNRPSWCRSKMQKSRGRACPKR